MTRRMERRIRVRGSEVDSVVSEPAVTRGGRYSCAQFLLALMLHPSSEETRFMQGSEHSARHVDPIAKPKTHQNYLQSQRAATDRCLPGKRGLSAKMSRSVTADGG